MQTDETIRKRILALCESGDPENILQPSMDPLVGIYELCDFFLGKDYYIVNSVNNKQAVTQIVYDIERKYKKFVD